MKQLYRFLTEDEKCLCPECKTDNLAVITDRGTKFSYKTLRSEKTNLNNLINQLTLKRIECLKCHATYLIDWTTRPISYAYVERRKK